MKYLISNIKLLALYMFLAMCIISCSEDDKLSLEIQDTVERGAVIRTISIVSGDFNIFDSSSIFEVIIEEQDLEDGALLSDVDVYLSFVDNSEDNGSTSADERLFTTLGASSFSFGDNGLPRSSFSMTLEEALSSLGITNDPSSVTGGDEVNIRMVLNLTDGRSFTDVNASGNVSGGSFFSSPYVYRAGIKCIPVQPFTGNYTLEVSDSFGDGWDGAFITVNIDGDTTDYTITSGSAGSFDINVPDGTQELVWTYTPGNFESEHSFELFGPNGEVAAAGGPGPTPGEIVLNICE
ncbi:hypothetical protein [Flagellimonas sp. 2504JD1-5]